jgi:hypothetical protein
MAWRRNQVSDRVENDSILVIASKLKSNDLSEHTPYDASVNPLMEFAILLAYDEKMIRFVPRGRSKVITLPFRLSNFT